MRYAIVIGGIVDNVVIWDGISAWSPPDGSQAVQLDAGQACSIGWTYDGTTFAEPEEP